MRRRHVLWVVGSVLVGLEVPAVEIKRTASDGAINDEFGYSVSISGDYAVVGAWNNQIGANTYQGSAYVFSRNQGGTNNWGQLKQLVASDGGASDNFGAAVAVSGDYAIVGAFNDNVFSTGDGSAYIFARNQGGADNWGEVKKINSGVLGNYAAFGRSLVIYGDTAVVGAPSYLNNAGRVYMYARNEGGADNWGQFKVFELGLSDDYNGGSVAMFGDHLVVGAERSDVGGNADQGYAYIYARNNGGANAWGRLKQFSSSDGAASDEFGRSVAISGDYIFVGANKDDVGANADQGSVYVFYRNQGGADNWGQVKKLTASDGAGLDNFGLSVAIAGDSVIVGSYGDDDNGDGSGSVYTFLRNYGGTDNWGQVDKQTASDGAAGDRFGWSVAITARYTIVGAYQDDVGASNQGSAYIYENVNDLSLPVELTSFTASASAENVTFHWSTASEVQNSHFILERSTGADGPWEQIATIPGAGNSPFQHDYRFTDRRVEPGVTYWYTLSDVDFSGLVTRHPVVEVTASLAPSRTVLHANHPNPFNPATRIRLTIAHPGTVTLTIHNAAGQRVRTLVNAERSAGSHEVVWDGRDDRGMPVASGAYIVRLATGQATITRRVALVR